MGRIDYVNSVKAGTTVFASPLSFLSVLPPKAVFIYIVRSLHFIPSLCFILSPESAFYTWPVFYTESTVYGPQSVFYTDRFQCTFVTLEFLVEAIEIQ